MKVIKGLEDLPDLTEGVKDIEIKVYPDVMKKLKLGEAQYNVLYLIDGIIGDPEDPFWRLRNVSLGLVAGCLEISRQRVNAIVMELWKKCLLKRTVLVGFPNVWPDKKWYDAMRAHKEKEENG